ncbi:DUF4405 domain-containing protein [Candidatus Woesearchaeota archaeon]|nr:DUF4405 domain-containing protein [Candidatus Woesearchaeota archaeon]MBT3537194.1 DUF4405 domain-containing protein [Candidatus Woesearchaeota archaeon]MBT4696660.1 DUF4405 domain-containing protein [Candidatus Woesearchaeota archaeon]MBT4716486.1 DUF4405 domain-containing protein [Candidatus Woesearchaeota archaeon]MBT7106496.1 DUF4405 domain-containing protein [Candidatus Woesearchaeota archaeon]
MNRRLLNYIIDVVMGIAFLVCFFTGVFKMPKLMSSILTNYPSFPLKTFSFIHDWSGIIMGVLVLAHLALHWKWMVAMTKSLIKKK